MCVLVVSICLLQLSEGVTFLEHSNLLFQKLHNDYPNVQVQKQLLINVLQVVQHMCVCNDGRDN